MDNQEMLTSVVVLGKGTLSIRVAEWFLNNPAYTLTCVVPSIPEPNWTESLVLWSRANGVPCVDSGHYRDIAGVKEENWSVDLAFSVFYSRIIRPWFLDKCNRVLNLHNGPLPRYRGVSPINWALKNGERIHGTTIHNVSPGIDSGPIVSQVLYSIYPEVDEVIDVYQRALRYGWALFQETMPLLDRITPSLQDESHATYYSREQNTLLEERRGFTRAESRGG